MSRFFIVDGHNVIFAIPRLQSLQKSGFGEEARQGLLDALRRFAQKRHGKILVVFDGGDPQRNQDVIREPSLEVVFWPRRQGGADERIIREATSRLQQGHKVTVVTNDVSTLASALPKAVDHLRVQAFWQTCIDEAEGKEDKRVEGDFSDLEKEMLAHAAAAEPEDGGKPVAAAASRPQNCVEGKDALRELLRLKRAKGKARHERLFKRR